MASVGKMADSAIPQLPAPALISGREGQGASEPCNAGSSKTVRHGIWRQGLWLSVSSFAQSGLSVAQNLLVSRFYGPGAVLDALSACNGIVRYFNDLVSGLNRAFLQNYILLGRERSRAEQLFWACQVGLFSLLGAVTVGFWVFCQPLLAWIYPSLAKESRVAAGSLLPLLFLGLTFTVGFQINNCKAVARQQTVLVAVSQMAVVTVTLVATLLSLPVIGLAGVLTVKAAAIAGASVWLFVGFKQRPEFSRAVLRDLGLVAQDATWLVVLGGLSGGILLLENWFASAMPEGRLTTISWARQFAFMISMLLQGGMRQVLSAHFQELVRDEKRGQLLASVRKIIEYSVMMGALVAVGTFFAGREGLQILFGGSSWRPEAITRLWEVCSVYSLVILVACLGGLLVPVLVATKSFRLFLLVELVRLGSFTLCAWLWREHDLIGLAAAQVVQQFLGTGLVVILVCGYLQRKPCWSDLKVFFRLAAVIAPTAAGLWLGQTAAHWLMPAATGVMGAWRHLALIICIALPGFSTTLWLGSCWEVPPMKQATQAARRFLNRHRAGIPNR